MTVTTDPHGGVSCIELQPLRSRLSPQIVYLTAACAIALALFAPATPSPLYGIYASRWHLSAAAVTGIFAASALGVLVSLLLARRISDEGGRRPVLLVAIAGISASPILYMLAASAAWLVAARLSQGVATGIAVSTASAALLDLHPRRDPVATGITNGVASAGGSGAGLEELASSYPDVEVLTDPIYVRDRNVYTSAGVTTGSDLTLVLVLVLVLEGVVVELVVHVVHVVFGILEGITGHRVPDPTHADAAACDATRRRMRCAVAPAAGSSQTPAITKSLTTVSVGWAPFRSQCSARAWSIRTSDGSARGA